MTRNWRLAAAFYMLKRGCMSDILPRNPTDGVTGILLLSDGGTL